MTCPDRVECRLALVHATEVACAGAPQCGWRVWQQQKHLRTRSEHGIQPYVKCGDEGCRPVFPTVTFLHGESKSWFFGPVGPKERFSRTLTCNSGARCVHT